MSSVAQAGVPFNVSVIATDQFTNTLSGIFKISGVDTVTSTIHGTSATIVAGHNEMLEEEARKC